MRLQHMKSGMLRGILRNLRRNPLGISKEDGAHLLSLLRMKKLFRR